MLTDGLFAAFVLAATSILRFGPDWYSHWRPIVEDPAALLLLYSLGWVGVLSLSGLYRLRARWSIRGDALDLLRATALMVAIVLAVLFWFRLPDVSRSYLTLLFPLQYVVTLGIRAGLRILFRRYRTRGLNTRFVLVAGAGPRGLAFARKLHEHEELGLSVIGFLDEDPNLPASGPWRRLGGLEAIHDVFHQSVVDEVVICLPFSQWDRVDAVAAICEEEGKIVRIPMDLLDRALSAGRVEDLDGTPVYSIVTGPDRILGLALKRAIDLAVAAVTLVILSPVFGAVAFAIRAREGSPVLFRQRRVGLHGRVFEVLKFRTMRRDAEAMHGAMATLSDPRAFKLTDDPRITGIGHVLRRTSLDELPQLWNVLRGEMSLVGPRPAPPREVEAYDIWHRRRLSMKPGITGLWQVTARRSDDFEERASLDLTYIDRWSLWLDVKILARTIPAALEGR
jgi:exopolysaccharide biosynthesis polyprenyl glycosylphosphotransferase